MAKGRMIHTRIWRSETLCAYGLRERLLWIGLVTNADDQGRGRAHPGLVRSDVFPLEDVPLDEITTALAAFADDGMLILYDSDGKQLYQVANWWDYQGSMTWAWPSDYPPPDGWTDRIRYRKGNNVAEENWQGDGGMDDAPPDESEPTASPPRDHNEPEPKRAPNGNGNSNGNGIVAPRGAPTPEPEKPKPKRPPAVNMFRSMAHRFPAKSWWDTIDTVVGSDSVALEKWGRTVFAWVGLGWKPTNVKGMLECYQRGEIPGEDHKTGPPGDNGDAPPKQPDHYMLVHGVNNRPVWEQPDA